MVARVLVRVMGGVVGEWGVECVEPVRDEVLEWGIWWRGWDVCLEKGASMGCAGDKGIDSRSTTGTAVFYNGALVDAMCKRQTATSVSSAEAEIYALAESVRRVRAVAYRASELGATIRLPLRVHVDNKAGISFQNSTNNATRLLGCFDLREKWVQELRDKSEIVTVKIDTASNPADLFTKCHPDARFKALLKHIVARGNIE